MIFTDRSLVVLNTLQNYNPFFGWNLKGKKLGGNGKNMVLLLGTQLYILSFQYYEFTNLQLELNPTNWKRNAQLEWMVVNNLQSNFWSCSRKGICCSEVT